MTETCARGEPFERFQAWFAEAEAAEPRDPNAMSLASAGPDGRPSVRMVLLKGADEHEPTGAKHFLQPSEITV